MNENKSRKVKYITLSLNILSSIILFCFITFWGIVLTEPKTERFVYLNNNETMLVIDDSGEMYAIFDKHFNIIPKGSTYNIWQKLLDINVGCVYDNIDTDTTRKVGRVSVDIHSIEQNFYKIINKYN